MILKDSLAFLTNKNKNVRASTHPDKDIDDHGMVMMMHDGWLYGHRYSDNNDGVNMQLLFSSPNPH